MADGPRVCLCEFEAVSACDAVSVWRLRNCCHLVCLSANVAASESVLVAQQSVGNFGACSFVRGAVTTPGNVFCFGKLCGVCQCESGWLGFCVITCDVRRGRARDL